MEKEGIILPLIMLLSIAVILFSLGRITGFFVNDNINNRALEEQECINSCISIDCKLNDLECKEISEECIKQCKV